MSWGGRRAPWLWGDRRPVYFLDSDQFSQFFDRHSLPVNCMTGVKLGLTLILYQVSSDDVEQFGIPSDLCTSLLLLAKKLSTLAPSTEEYVLLKAVVLLNPGNHANPSVTFIMSHA